MSGKLRTLTRPALTNVLLPKSELRAGNAGVIAASFGADANTVCTAQRGFATEVRSRMTIWGIDASGRARDKLEYRVADPSKSSNELVGIVDDDSVDYVSRTDRGMAEAVKHASERFKRKELTPRIDFGWADDIARDPDRRARLQAELGTSSIAPPTPADGHSFDEPTLSVTPARDRDQSLHLFWGRFKTRGW